MQASAWREVPSHAIYFATYSMMLNKFKNADDGKTPFYGKIISSGTAGISYAVFSHPFDVLKTEI